MSKGLFSEEKRAQLEAVARKGGLLLAEYNKPLWPAPYNEATPESCYRFLVECIWTFDEATGKDTPMPDKDYLRLIVDEWYDCRKTGRQLHFIKSRRLVVTWALRAIELHEAGLARGRYVIAAEVFEGNNGACGFVFRIKYLYDQLRARYTSKEAKEYGWNLKEATATGGRGSSQAQEVVLPNGSTFIAGNSDPSKFQGSGAGYICLEELSQYAEVERMIAQAAINTQGAPGHVGGMLTTVSNATENGEFLTLMEPHDGERLLSYGVARARDNTSGHRVVEIHYAADPEKGEEWASKYRGTDIPIRQWDREYEGVISAFGGEPVFACYDSNIHENRFTFPGSNSPGVLIAGWDVGVTMNPAFVLGFVSQEPRMPSQLQILMEVLAPGMSMEEFAPKVAQELDKHWPSWRLREHEIIHVADPSGASRQGNTGKSAFDVARAKGFFLRRSTNGLQGRLSCVTRFLMNWAVEGESPLMVINKPLCKVVCTAFGGGYSYRDNKLVGAARTLREPRKDGYSHPMDAVQYLCMEAEKHIGGKVSLETIDRFSPRRAGSRIQTRTV